MTTRREVPFAADTLAWVHNELAEIKSRLALSQQAAEQSRGLARDAVEQTHQVRSRVEQLDGQQAQIEHLQNDMRAVYEQVVRAQDDIHSLRQSREELERRILADGERLRQERNDIGRRFSEIERHVEGWHERVSSYEEHNRRNLEAAAQLTQRIEVVEGQADELDTLQTRTVTTISRIDQELQRVAGALPALEREQDVHHERANTAFEMLRRVETEIEAVKTETNQISRIDDRLELVQAERTRHNERLNDLTAEFTKLEARVGEHNERLALTDVRVSTFQDEMRKIKEGISRDREAIAGHLHALSDLQADLRKREIIALEKEIREIRGRALNFAEE